MRALFENLQEMVMSLWSDFILNPGRPIHKWKYYFPVYERYLRKFCNQSAVILEIGCGSGGSLQMWKRFFGPYARIVGIDNNSECSEFEEDQIKIRIGEQNNTTFLDSVMEEFGPVQVVIDDGSHMMNDVRQSFEHLYYHPAMDLSGVYIVEDLHTAYWPNYGGGYLCQDSFIEIAKRHVDELNAYHSLGAVSPGRFTAITLAINFHDSMVVYERGRRGPNVSFQSGLGKMIVG
jgi:hypothetical protein